VISFRTRKNCSPDWEKTTTGAKARKPLWRSDAALEGPLFHGRASSPPIPKEIETSLRPTDCQNQCSTPQKNHRMHHGGRTAVCSDVEERRFSAASSASKPTGPQPQVVTPNP
jgi:hypothetical protein